MFNVLFLFGFSFLSRKTKNTGHSKNPKKQKCRKKRKKLGELCSQIVFLIFWGGQKHICWKPNKNSGFNVFWKRNRTEKGWVKNLAKVESKISQSTLRNMIGRFLAQKWQCLSLFFCYFEKSHSPCRKKKFFEKKGIKEGHLDRFWLKKGQLLDRFLTLQHIFCADIDR